MGSDEYEKLKEALSKAATPEARKEAADAMKRYLESKKGAGSRPTIVSLSAGGKYPSAIPLEKAPDILATNPEFYELMKRIVTKEK